MSKEVYEVSLNDAFIAHGYMGTKHGELYDLAVEQWKEFFMNTRGFFKSHLTPRQTYDHVMFLHNANFLPYTQIFPDVWNECRILPILHAAVILFMAGRPVGMYLFNHAEDMMAMIKAYPYDQFIMQNGRRYVEVAKERRVKFSIKDYKEKPISPTNWENPHQYDEYDFLSVPLWPDRELRDLVKRSRSLKLLNILDGLASQLPPELNNLIKSGCVGISEPRYRYVFETPIIDIIVNHDTVVLGEDVKSFLLIQNDMCLNDADDGVAH